MLLIKFYVTTFIISILHTRKLWYRKIKKLGQCSVLEKPCFEPRKLIPEPHTRICNRFLFWNSFKASKSPIFFILELEMTWSSSVLGSRLWTSKALSLFCNWGLNRNDMFKQITETKTVLGEISWFSANPTFNYINRNMRYKWNLEFSKEIKKYHFKVLYLNMLYEG